MGVYGNTYKSAFSGLGKPSIKLEFEDNESLVAFSKKMQDEEPAPVQWNEEEEMFTPVEGVALTEDDFFDVLEQNTEPYIYKDFNEKNVISVFGKPKHREDSYGNIKYAFEIKTPLKGSESKVYIWADMNHALFDNSTKENRSAFWTMIKPTIERPAIVFYKDGKNHFVKCFTMPDGKKVVFSFIPSLVIEKNIKTFLIRDERKKGQIYKKYKDGGSVRFLDSNPTFNGIERHDEPILFVECRLYCDKDNSNISENQIFNEKSSLGAPGDTYIITDTRTRARKDLEDTAALKKYDIRKFSGEELAKMQTDDPLLYEQIKSDLQQQKTPKKQEVKTKEDWMQEVDEMLKTWKDEAFYKTTPQKLDEPGSRVKARYISNLRDIIIKYFIEEINKGNFERVSNIANILGYKYADNERISQTNGLISQFVGIVPTLPEGWRISKNTPKWLPKLPKGFVYIDNGKEMFDYRHKIMPTQKGLGKTANNSLYNNNDILDCRGLKPTYKILQSYDAFFAPAQHSQTFAGVGLDDTKKLIAGICKAHYKDCARIAQHLKGDTKLQSVFNLWHWLRHNIRYEYDREGREEVRTPLRTWADRRRGVDCDCLSVFAWCVLKCMGYEPAFELVCFKGKKQPSHILVNLDGIRCDRVWFVFNSLPPGVTNSEIYRITDRATAAQLAGLFN